MTVELLLVVRNPHWTVPCKHQRLPEDTLLFSVILLSRTDSDVKVARRHETRVLSGFESRSTPRSNGAVAVSSLGRRRRLPRHLCNIFSENWVTSTIFLSYSDLAFFYNHPNVAFFHNYYSNLAFFSLNYSALLFFSGNLTSTFFYQWLKVGLIFQTWFFGQYIALT